MLENALNAKYFLKYIYNVHKKYVYLIDFTYTGIVRIRDSEDFR